mmetsp:Transcript_51943/g.113904  ORF Transcript_51943/g.113904 Transcript_51943/m.113904 type:complete len:276 (-) Transcript_51943:104-931(-)
MAIERGAEHTEHFRQVFQEPRPSPRFVSTALFTRPHSGNTSIAPDSGVEPAARAVTLRHAANGTKKSQYATTAEGLQPPPCSTAACGCESASLAQHVTAWDRHRHWHRNSVSSPGAVPPGACGEGGQPRHCGESAHCASASVSHRAGRRRWSQPGSASDPTSSIVRLKQGIKLLQESHPLRSTDAERPTDHLVEGKLIQCLIPVTTMRRLHHHHVVGLERGVASLGGASVDRPRKNPRMPVVHITRAGQAPRQMGRGRDQDGTRTFPCRKFMKPS